MTSRAEQLLRKSDAGKGDNSRAKAYQRASEWPNCQIPGCPLPATIKADKCTCAYHHGKHGYDAECTTEAIKEFKPFINKLNEMIYWDVRTWKEKKPQLMGWMVLPATPEEMERPTMYLVRLRAWIDKGIKAKAELIYNEG